MNKIDENMDWEKEASHLASLPRSTPYRVPDNYFDDLQARINQSVFVAELMQKEKQVFTVPQNYFENLSEQIESKIATAQLKSLIKEDGFKIPANYFDNLNAAILNQTVNATPKIKTISLWRSNFVKYAAAACFVIATATGLYFSQQNEVSQIRTAELVSEQMLYDIDESVIIEHLQESENMSTSLASDKEIENYILENYSSSDISNNL
ncbi:MAG: hypothetical protein V4546_12250 [Bacteroidota bacterium]